MSDVTRKQRVLGAFRREAVDRLPTQSNYTPAMGVKLAAHFQIPIEELPERLDNHMVRVDLQYDRRMSDDGRTAFDWWGAGWSTETEGYWHTFSPLAESMELDAFAWPDPQAPQLFDAARQTVAQRGAEYFVAPNLGMCLFERAWSLRGFDRLLLDFADRPEWVEELLERITGIQIALIRRYLEAGIAHDADALFRIEKEVGTVRQKLMALVGEQAIDGAYDKLNVKIVMPEFPLRLLPPYEYPTDQVYETYRQYLQTNFPHWLVGL